MLSPRVVFASIAILLMGALSGCGERKAADSKKRSVDGHFAHTIAGQVARHGPEFSALQAQVMSARVAQNPKDIAARQGLAEALAAGGMHDLALEALDKLEEAMPGRYETAYQRAVVYNKMGDFAAALTAAKAATKRRASGHDETGDYVLWMLEWLNADQATQDSENFIGISYSEPLEAVGKSKDVNQQQLVALLEEFPAFSNGYLVLGDWMAANAREQLAVRSYLRGLSISGNNAELALLETRLKRLEEKWASEAEASADVVYDDDYRDEVADEFDKALRWASGFQEAERELVEALPQLPEPDPGKDPEPRSAAALSLELPDEKASLAALKEEGIAPPSYYHVGLVKAGEQRFGFLTRASPFMWIAVGIAIGLYFLAKRYVADDRRLRRFQK